MVDSTCDWPVYPLTTIYACSFSIEEAIKLFVSAGIHEISHEVLLLFRVETYVKICWCRRVPDRGRRCGDVATISNIISDALTHACPVLCRL